MKHRKQDTGGYGLPPATLALRDEMASGAMHCHTSFAAGNATVDVMQGTDSLWLLVRRKGMGGFALRTAYSPGRAVRVEATDAEGALARFAVATALGEFDVRIALPGGDEPLLHWTVTLTPAADLTVPFWPRDLIPLDDAGDPVAARGEVHAAQRGLNSGLVFLTLEKPQFGTALYFQNLTALNDYCTATGTTPDGRVGGQWPDLGYTPAPAAAPLPGGKAVVISDAFLHWAEAVPQNPRQAARLYLDLLVGVYRHLDRPAPEYHDWPGRAEETLRDLAHAPGATIRHYGNLYLHPYLDAEYPDSMVQLTTLLPLREYADWQGKEIPLAAELRRGVGRFFDPELGTLRRYLPNVGADKDADEVDSWYLYHPLANMGRLALAGDKNARDLFLRSLDYAVKVARHFRYAWPVQFNVRTLDVITGVRKPGDPGQSDTGGLYAWVMLQAYEITGEGRYREEAEAAIRATKDLLFELEYQANITSWGMLACLQLWKITADRFFLDQSLVFCASLFHNALIWESQIKAARHYPIFLGMTCLHDGPYMALYECFETCAAFHHLLALAEDDLPESARLLLAEYIKYSLSRAWYYYPSELPPDAIATEVRNGHIDPKLSFPLEDLYANGQPAGQVGQEIYGCGAAFSFATRCWHRLEHAPFLLFCEYPLYDLEQTDEPCMAFRVRGTADFSCHARLIPTGRAPLPPVTIQNSQGAEIVAQLTDKGHWEFAVPGGAAIEIRWENTHPGRKHNAAHQ